MKTDQTVLGKRRQLANEFDPRIMEPHDFISSMPDIVISNILDRLPIQEAVRTGILSRDWTYKWTMVTQLVIDYDFYMSLKRTGNLRSFGTIVCRILLRLKGVINKFVLLNLNKKYSIIDVEYLTNWITLSSKNGLEELTLNNFGSPPPKLSRHLFSCLLLKHLDLTNCHLDHVSDFQGFPNLRSLFLNIVTFKSYRCGEFLIWCPNLECLVLFPRIRFNVNLDEIAKLLNLKKLLFGLDYIENTKMITSSRIIQAMCCLIKLRELEIHLNDCQLLVDDKTSVTTVLPCLKKLSLYNMIYTSNNLMSFAIELICGSPNLQILLINGVPDGDESDYNKTGLVDFSKLGQLQLRTVDLYFTKGQENEECLIKTLLASSPLLEKMFIHVKSPLRFADDDEEFEYGQKYLNLPRASPLVEIEIS